MTYTDLTNYLAQIIGLPTTPSETNFTTILPAAIFYAENRMQRDLDFLATRMVATISTTGGQQSVSITSSPAFVVVESVVNASNLSLTPQSVDFIRLYNGAAQGVPVDYALFNNSNLLLGPIPSSSSSIYVTGTQRVTPLSGSNATNYLSLLLPDLYIAACMVFLSGWMKNYGAMVDDPQQGMTWEMQYRALKEAALVEEFRLKQLAAGLTSRMPDPVAGAVG